MIAILNCTKKKQTYSCSAKEMYSANYNFVDKLNFIEKHYGEYYIMSVKYGIITPDTIIESYNLTLSRDKVQLGNEITYPTKEHLQWLRDNVNTFISNNLGKQIDFHTPQLYSNLIKDKDLVRLVKQERTASNTTKYRKALEMDNLNDAIQYMNNFNLTPKVKETEKWFTHPELGEFYGKSYELFKIHEGRFDKGGLYQVSTGRSNQHKGWRIKCK